MPRRANKPRLTLLPIAIDERIAFRWMLGHAALNLAKRHPSSDGLVVGDAQTAQALLQANGAERNVVFDVAKEVAKGSAKGEIDPQSKSSHISILPRIRT